MRISKEFLRSKVARRIFGLFVLCALLPIVVLALISFTQVTNQLEEQTYSRLLQASKNLGFSSFERLTLLEAEMKMAASNLAEITKTGTLPDVRASDQGSPRRFLALESVAPGGKTTPIIGHMERPPILVPADQQHLLSGKTLVSAAVMGDGYSRLLMSQALDPKDLKHGVLVGEINPAYLWNPDALPLQSELCVLQEGRLSVYCTGGVPSSIRRHLAGKMTSPSQGQFEWSDGGKTYLASYWSLPLRYTFGNPGWTMVLSLPKDVALAPLARFRQTFPYVILMALWIVLLLSIIEIRRSLIPLEKLKSGTEQIACGDFNTRVAVASHDEFEQLGSAFNTMASRLGRQFNALNTISEIDRAVLSALDTEKIVETVLQRLPEILPCEFASVTLLDPEAPGTVRTYVPGARRGEKWWRMGVKPEEMERLRQNRESLLIHGGIDIPGFLAPIAQFGVSSILLLPIFLEETLQGSINVGYRNSPTFSPQDLAQARQVADQVAVALSNARLIEKLEQLNWGTLTALARAIDAKSAWTGGHSERVTKLAMEIAGQMGYAGNDLERMHRGGLLHDIGKIGTPLSVLDKPGKLTPEELQVMRGHVRTGAHILEPIPGYGDLLPIVLHHHEWFDGSGYPDGLAGEAISLDGRIFAVADCFDALISDRPYRAGLPLERVMEMIRQGTGRQYDPKVVQAFLKVMEGHKAKESEAERTAAPAKLASNLNREGAAEERIPFAQAAGPKAS